MEHVVQEVFAQLGGVGQAELGPIGLVIVLELDVPQSIDDQRQNPSRQR